MKRNMYFVIAIIIMISLVMVCDSFAWIEMEALSKVESSGDPRAFNKVTKATGKFQITPICLKDFNEQTNNDFTMKDLFDAKINSRVTKWYLFIRIPQLLKAKGINDPTDEQILAHYGGYKNVGDAKGYLAKYEKALVRVKSTKKKY